MLHTVGVHDNHHRTGVSTATLAWMFNGLPSSYALGVMRFGTYNDNNHMIAFGRKFGAGADHQQRWGKEGEDAEKMDAALYDIPVAVACNVLGISGPAGEEFHFTTNEVRGVQFQCLYFGRHPRRLRPDERVIVGTL